MEHTPTPFERGEQHYLEGIPRTLNPYYFAAYNNGARTPENRSSVQSWFSGWDMAKVQSDFAIEVAIECALYPEARAGNAKFRRAAIAKAEG